ncbi:hypothetical protein SmJEL517_g03038 [Synchytrium microbalum]|uniref:Cyclin-dependent kinase 1 n=1 Tax=Synchytrium microbalum TaxID=1806994 RepID=A0A507BZS9_9FUNG|nr:uncharacterized protein SmJEL517_g03038 [Synchytrium microbalum]TPX34307.1 hypothetical protein SmJEL517_g03038 [Synchytrium microbalum]
MLGAPSSTANIWMSYEKLEKLGQGVYGKVYKARDRRESTTVAVKKTAFERGGVSATTVREVALLKGLNHINIVKVLDVQTFNEKPFVYMVLEYADTDLNQYIKTFRTESAGLPQSDVKHFLKQLLDGIAHCHGRRTLHRDLKPSNLLVTSDKTLKIADFGLSRCYSIPGKAYSPEVVTVLYRAPELLLGQREYSMAVDVWSIGCIFAEMVRGQPLFWADSEQATLHELFRKLGSPTADDFPFELNQPLPAQNRSPEQTLDKYVTGLEPAGVWLLKDMLEYNPSRRIRAHRAAQHAFFFQQQQQQ